MTTTGATTKSATWQRLLRRLYLLSVGSVALSVLVSVFVARSTPPPPSPGIVRSALFHLGTTLDDEAARAAEAKRLYDEAGLELAVYDERSHLVVTNNVDDPPRFRPPHGPGERGPGERGPGEHGPGDRGPPPPPPPRHGLDDDAPFGGPPPDAPGAEHPPPPPPGPDDFGGPPPPLHEDVGRPARDAFGGPPHEGFAGPPHEGFAGPPHEGFAGPPPDGDPFRHEGFLDGGEPAFSMSLVSPSGARYVAVVQPPGARLSTKLALLVGGVLVLLGLVSVPFAIGLARPLRELARRHEEVRRVRRARAGVQRDGGAGDGVAAGGARAARERLSRAAHAARAHPRGARSRRRGRCRFGARVSAGHRGRPR